MDGLSFEYMVRSILELGISNTVFKYLSEENKNFLKKKIKQIENSTYGLTVSKNKLKIGLYKGDDPAGLASANVYNDCNKDELSFIEAKAIILYSIFTANNLIQNYLDENLKDHDDYKYMEQYLLRVEECKDCICLFKNFGDYCNNIYERFKNLLLDAINGTK